MCRALEHLQARLVELESDQSMRKGRLMELLLADPSIEWDAIFAALSIRRRHRLKGRWRRAVIQTNMRRVFPRGGARANSGRRRLDGGQRKKNTVAPTVPLKSALWFVDVRELQAFAPLEVWERFRITFPVLSVYRAGWVATTDVSRALQDCVDLPLWEATWQCGQTTVKDIARILQWPTVLLDSIELILPLAQRLWPEEPWDASWIIRSFPGRVLVARGSVPFLRRVACLLHGFHLGGCHPNGVWEAIVMPNRG